MVSTALLPASCTQPPACLQQALKALSKPQQSNFLEGINQGITPEQLSVYQSLKTPPGLNCLIRWPEAVTYCSESTDTSKVREQTWPTLAPSCIVVYEIWHVCF